MRIADLIEDLTAGTALPPVGFTLVETLSLLRVGLASGHVFISQLDNEPVFRAFDPDGFDPDGSDSDGSDEAPDETSGSDDDSDGTVPRKDRLNFLQDTVDGISASIVTSFSISMTISVVSVLCVATAVLGVWRDLRRLQGSMGPSSCDSCAPCDSHALHIDLSGAFFESYYQSAGNFS